MSLREFPRVWGSFERTLENRTLKFQIEDVSEALWDTTVEFMLRNYIQEDVWWLTAGTAGDPVAVQEYRILLSAIVQQNMSLACLLTEADGSGRSLVAVNMCMPQKKGFFIEHSPPKSKAGLLSLRMFAEAMKVTTIYDKFEVNEYMMGSGLSVAPQYRGLGIAVELLKARLNLAKTLGFKVTGGIFTSESAQRSAEKAGYGCCYQTPYKEFGNQCDIHFDTKKEYLKIFATKV
ncbi:unnamed protein product [Plutella xylostella]|uniref:(diamondback moth) hypothetical protein n=1 Tax=Plutella xylostella TaxID=51655 RepID=A0A8S4G4Y5_PLUXY|nr:unnamed protein product [Plutella xylostella]